MKKTTILLIVLCFLTVFSSFAQTIRRVNNGSTASGLNVYATVQAAHDAAVNGDIIYIEPAFYNGSVEIVNCSKQLTFIGNGFRIPDNLTANSPADTRSATPLYFYLNSGSAGTKITAMNLGYCEIKVPNVTIDRCLITGQMRLSYTPSVGPPPNYATTIGDNFTITNCFIQYNGGSGGSNVGAISSIPISLGVNRFPSGVVVKNNIADAGISLVGGIESSTVSYNTITSELGSVTSTAFSNNIVYSPTGGTGPNNIPASYPSCTFNNNISMHPTTVYFPAGNGNQNQASTTGFFQNILTTSQQGTNKDNWYSLGVSSPGLTAGVGSTQIGAFGGTTPYRLSGLPAIPIITNFVESGVGSTSTPLSVNVTVRGNN
jgi:hypothetical protein